jgi:hypothetical protein
MVPNRSKNKDHRIRLNDEELALLSKLLKNYDPTNYSPEMRKQRSLYLRLTALGCYRR